MTESNQTEAKPAQAPQPKGRRRRSRRGRLGIVLIAAVAFMVVLAGLGWTVLSGRGVVAPDWVTERIETTINAGYEGGHVEVGRIEVALKANLAPYIALRQVQLFDDTGRELLALPHVQATLSRTALMQREFLPSEVLVSGARVSLLRDEAGVLNFDLGGEAASTGFNGNFGDVLMALDTILDRPMLAPIEKIAMERVVISYSDAGLGRSWNVSDGAVTFRKDESHLLIDVEAPITNDTGNDTRLAVSLETRRGSASAQMSASLEHVPARDIAAQSRALSWLSVLEAPISGWLRASTDAAGEFEGLNGTLEIAQGAITPTPQSKAVPFDNGKVYFTYEAADERLRLSEFVVNSPVLELVGEGQAYLSDLVGSSASSFLGQLRFSHLKVSPEGVFDKPATVDSGALDFRMNVAPFHLEVGQLVVSDGVTKVLLAGDVTADETGWDVALDASSPGVHVDHVLSYWPVNAIPNTRRWIKDNVLAGQLGNVYASLRAHQGEPRRTALSFDVIDGKLRVLRQLPPITGVEGHMVIHDKQLTAVANAGTMVLETGQQIDVGGSVFRLGDITQKPAQAEVALKTDSTIPAALELIDHEPFKLLKNWPLGTEFADGRAALAVNLSFPLVKKLALEDVGYDAQGRLHTVRSDILVKGKSLRADALDFALGGGELRVSGDATLDGVPLFASWSQPTGKGATDSLVEGTIEMSQKTVDAFRLGLPRGSVSGRGTASFEIELARGAAPKLRLRSDLNRVGLAIDALGWTKARALTGSLQVNATLGEVPRVEQLSLKAAGLELQGDVSFRQNGGLEALTMSRLRLGDWLDVTGRLVGRGLNAPVGVEIDGGRMSLAGLPQRRGNGEGGPLSVDLDELQITTSLRLAPFRGTFSSRGGFSGTFEGRVNGDAAVSGTVVPSPTGSAVRVRSKLAGEVLRSAGVFKSARGGEMDLSLNPTGISGNYEGTVRVAGLKVRDAPVLASLLSAASIVGILEQMTAEGLLFTDLQAAFRLNPDRLIVREGSAVGPSMGVSAEGVFDLVNKRMDVQGVISPLYVLNGIGQILTRNREGLFGFNYRMQGPVSSPRTTVNPLSILTPGIFRDLFRSAPPGTGQ
ncbi:MAG: YhdP family protein [Brevirhabdus sp.]